MTSSKLCQRPKFVTVQRGVCKHSIRIIVLGTLCACWILWSNRTPGAYTRPVKRVWLDPAGAAAGTTASQLLPQVHPTELPSASMGRSSTKRTTYGCPLHSVYENPWVKDNIALTYALDLKDGLGGQVYRIMGIYAIAKTLGVGYVHSPFTCIGHIGPQSNYRNQTCNDLEPKERLLVQRLNKHLGLPNTTTANTTAWKSVHMYMGCWRDLAVLVEQAVQQQQPTVIRLEMMPGFIDHCPDMFHHVPSWLPEWMYKGGSKQVPAISQPWLLTGVRPVRIAVHMRRGDLSDNMDHSIRWRPVSYYINLVKGITQILERLNHDYTIEWFTEASDAPERMEDLRQIRSDVPNVSVFLDSDLLWNWHQMADADVFVMSVSGYSFVPAVVNAQGLLIHARRKPRQWYHPSNWLEPADDNGTLSEPIVREIHRRWGSSGKATGVPGSQHQHQSHQRVVQQ